jgi:hypothetical protein
MNRKMKKKKRKRQSPVGEIVIGVAWYSPSQWVHFREVSADREEVEETHTEWLASYERLISDLAAKGIRVLKVPVDVEELEKWCRERNKAIDGDARAEYVLEIVQRSHATLEVVPGKAV